MKATLKVAKPSKHRNIKTEIDGIAFDSRKEANRYCELKLLQKAGVVTSFELQPEFLLQDKFVKNGKTYRAIKYIADFKVTYPDGRVEIEDVKGQMTDVFKIKWKLFERLYPEYELKII